MIMLKAAGALSALFAGYVLMIGAYHTTPAGPEGETPLILCPDFINPTDIASPPTVPPGPYICEDTSLCADLDDIRGLGVSSCEGRIFHNWIPNQLQSISLNWELAALIYRNECDACDSPGASNAEINRCRRPLIDGMVATNRSTALQIRNLFHDALYSTDPLSLGFYECVQAACKPCGG